MDSRFIHKLIAAALLKEESQKEHSLCPKCGSTNTKTDLNWIDGAHFSWSEWCNDCGWKKEHNTKEKK